MVSPPIRQIPSRRPRRAASRIGPFFSFDRNRLNGYRYWPAEAVGTGGAGAICYFRAENGTYFDPGPPFDPTKAKHCTDPGDPSGIVYAAQDSRLSKYDSSATPPWKPVWINPKSFQIFSSGLGLKYGNFGSSVLAGALNYPSGDTDATTGGFGYAQDTYDDIANFSNGRLEDAIP